MTDLNHLSNQPFLTRDNWLAPASPACYSDMGPEMAPWTTIDHRPAFEAAADPNPTIHRRAHTFPTFGNDEYSWTQQPDPPVSAGAFSEIPSIEVTSPESSRPQSPLVPPEQSGSPLGFSIPYRSSLFDVNDEPIGGQPPEHVESPPFLAMHRNLEEQIDYYGDYLSPIDQPPPISRRSSVASSLNDASTPETLARSHTRLHRSQTLPTTLNFKKPPNQDQLNMTLRSPRTRNYLQVYFQKVHPEFPVLDPRAFASRQPSGNTILTYQTLLAAAIGALQHHQSRALSSPYMRLAMSLHSEIDMWGSLSGVHCAILLAIYCFYEESMSFNDEVDQHRTKIVDSLHPAVNLWLHICQTAHTCLDLGLNLGFLSSAGSISMVSADKRNLVEVQMQAMFRNTFRVVYILDRRISRLKRRPTAIHEADLDADLVLEMMIDASEPLTVAAA
ncbi:uncharacterized protein Z518_09666 [Rhinocladiella mackenziei CBS 650.93]|uniref:Transcription factor domain-containing protein n=1 Tax=Rhinocladiella mackenziei CBS 650.93 TaxID=1442369 RepID=A0A0D2IBD6_9EURO|nr:uncharacterized protein Z518_09666 [Rhinocladiella mackenziei CBS 650.93]KIX00601.1 hypothetical protein Z518_09666 [Rhinocladiella mackenziei CBS 650.93]